MAEVQTGDIADRLTELHVRYYGHGPQSVAAHFSGDVLVVLFEEALSRAEITLIEAGQGENVVSLRRRFQQVMAQEFVTIVEEGTGRCVRSFVSDFDVEQHLAVEVFVLAETGQNMRGFEEAPVFEETTGEREERETP